MNKTIWVLVAATASALLAAVPLAHAGTQAVNVDFNYTGSDTYSGQGALSDPGNNYWNGVGTSNSGTTNVLTNAIASDGVTNTAVGVSVGSSGNGYGGNGSPSTSLDALLNDSPFAFSTMPITITGLPDSTAYTLYLYNGATYASPNQHFDTTYAVTGATTVDGVSGSSITMTGSTAQPDPNTTLTEGFNYAVFTGTTSATGEVDGTYDTYILSGLQISYAVPEPASLSLLGFSGLGLLARRRHTHA